MATEIQTEIEQAAKEPRQASDDGGSMQAHSLRDQMDADAYINGAAIAKKKHRGLLVAKFKPPGCQ